MIFMFFAVKRSVLEPKKCDGNYAVKTGFWQQKERIRGVKEISLRHISYTVSASSSLDHTLWLSGSPQDNNTSGRMKALRVRQQTSYQSYFIQIHKYLFGILASPLPRTQCIELVE